MKTLIYFVASIIVLFLSYRVNLKKAIIFSVLVSTFILINQIEVFSRGTVISLLFINAIPFITEIFKKDFDKHKAVMRTRFEERKKVYEELQSEDKQQIEANLERERRLHQVLSLYEISKDMSSCLAFEDILNIFSATLKKSFRFNLCRFIQLKDPNDTGSVYHIKLGHGIEKVDASHFDKEVTKIVLEKKKMISFSRQENPDSLRSLQVIKDFESLIAIPLFVEEKITGFLYIENIPRDYFENFTILASQFAIQYQKVALYKKVQEMSITDSLTEISTRRYFLERFSEEIRRSMRHKSTLPLLMLDLDHFKQNNDKFGHLVGDVILREVAGILKSNLREIDIIGRYGGEEFAIVLAGTGREEAFQAAERIRESIEAGVFKAYDEVVSTTVSIGVSVFPDDGVDVESLIESADRALYKAKETGRNRVC